MRSDEFQTQMNRLIETFGKSHYSTERLKILLAEVRNEPAEWFTKLVDHFIGEFRQAPLLPEFRDAALKERQRKWASRKAAEETSDWNPNKIYSCMQCQDTAVVMAKHVSEATGNYAFRCNCELGRQDGRAFPVWTNNVDYLIYHPSYVMPMREGA